MRTDGRAHLYALRNDARCVGDHQVEVHALDALARMSAQLLGLSKLNETCFLKANHPFGVWFEPP